MIDLRTTTRVSLTIEEFAEIVGKSRRAIYYWITKGHVTVTMTHCGRRITVDEAKRLALLTLGYLPRPAAPPHSVQSVEKSV